MVVLGVDAHKRTHTVVATDELGRKLSEKTVAATSEGDLVALEWAAQWPERTWAIEDCRHVTRRLESDLLIAGEPVVRVPTRLMAGVRSGGRERGKSDPIDALAVARAALREPDLPVARLDGEARELRLLVDHREDLVTERSRIQNRLRWHLHELLPDLDIPPTALKRYQRPRFARDGSPVHRGHSRENRSRARCALSGANSRSQQTRTRDRSHREASGAIVARVAWLRRPDGCEDRW